MCLHILACFCPPCSVCFKRGVGCDCCINILLSILGVIPGICHACYIVSQDDRQVNNTTVIVQPTAGPPPYAYSQPQTHHTTIQMN